jgi:hypothetical protein
MCESDGHDLRSSQVEALAALIAEREAAAEKRGRLAGHELALDRVRAKVDVCLDDYADGLQWAVEVIEKEVARATGSAEA